MNNVRKVAVDCGKGFTKVAFFDKDGNIRTKKFRSTKGIAFNMEAPIFGEGMNVLYEGKCCTIGMAGTGKTSGSSSKKDEIHKLCVMTAIAMVVDDGDEVELIIGTPAAFCKRPDDVASYKDFVAPTGKHEISIKYGNQSKVTKRFFIRTVKATYEGIGYFLVNKDKLGKNASVCDIGNLNINTFNVTNGNIEMDSIRTSELGYRYLLNQVTQALKTISPDVKEALVEQILSEDVTNRYLQSKPEESKKIIREKINEYCIRVITEIQASDCDLYNTKLHLIGGTVQVVQHELADLLINNFNNAPVIGEDSEFANVIGYLKLLG